MKADKTLKKTASGAPAKRGRGRPPGSRNKKAKKVVVAKVPGRGRGRPPGSTKVGALVNPVVKRGRGRPAGAVAAVKVNKSRGKKGDTGRRYSDAERAKILEVVNSNGRGGITKAIQQFGVSYIALRRWMQSSGIPVGRGGNGALDAKRLKEINEVTNQVKAVRKQMTSVFQMLKKISK